MCTMPSKAYIMEPDIEIMYHGFEKNDTHFSAETAAEAQRKLGIFFFAVDQVDP